MTPQVSPLAKAHAEGIVHRDRKPENLFITQQEEELLKVLDFGVAKLAGGPAGQPSTNTRTGALLGTPFYMSPEQARAQGHRSPLRYLVTRGDRVRVCHRAAAI